MATVTPINPEASEVERLKIQISRTSILNWDCWGETDVKQLARSVRAAAELARLATKGFHVAMQGNSLEGDSIEVQLVDDLVEMTAIGAFVLARQLGALEDEKPRDDA